MKFESEYIKNEINRLQQLLEDDNRFKKEFIKNKEKLLGLVSNYNNVNLKDKISEQNIFKYCGFEEYGRRIKINDFVSGYIAFTSSSQEEVEETKAHYIEEYNIKEYECNITNVDENFIVELTFKEDLWGKVIRSERKYYLYIYKTINKNDKNYYVRFDCIEFLAFVLKTTINDATMLLINAINKERKDLVEEYEKICEYNLNNIEERISEYPSLRVFLLKDIAILKAFINYVKENIYKLTEEDEKLYIYCPYINFGEIINKSGNTAGKYLNIFTALNLIKKRVDVDDKKNKNNRNAPARYIIRKFTESVLKEADEVARLFMLKNMKISDFNENKCKEILGEDKTNEIFFAQSNKKKGGKS